MTNLRPHRRAIPVNEVVDEMEKGKGRQFDPNLVEILLKEKIYDSSKVI
jgi:HD-GYP domain-containing protein (c-di-GMP phosphodiesterase class II)